MKQLKCILPIISFAISISCSEPNHHHRLEEEVNLTQKAEGMLKSLKDEVADYLNYRNKLRKENELLLKEIQEWDSMKEEDERFQTAFKRLEHDFLVFRESLGRFVAEIDSYSPNACTMRASTSLKATEWYVDCVTKIAFPEKWRQSEQDR